MDRAVRNDGRERGRPTRRAAPTRPELKQHPLSNTAEHGGFDGAHRFGAIHGSAAAPDAQDPIAAFFKKIDADHSGKIDRREFRTLFEDGDAARANEVFTEVDEENDNDNKLD